jgi:hypothetical protein
MISYSINGGIINLHKNGSPCGCSCWAKDLAGALAAKAVAARLSRFGSLDNVETYKAVMVARDECIDRGLIAG